MLQSRQIAICGSLAVAFWGLATLCIRFDPAAVTTGLRGDLAFALSIPVCWLSIRLTCRMARLQPDQILAGCMLVLGEAMLIDGIALRWFAFVYGVNDEVARTGAAWLLWGYGLSAWIAFVLAQRKLREVPA